MIFPTYSGTLVLLLRAEYTSSESMMPCCSRTLRFIADLSDDIVYLDDGHKSCDFQCMSSEEAEEGYDVCIRLTSGP